eukprot:4829915-Amphidinium_carterae.1
MVLLSRDMSRATQVALAKRARGMEKKLIEWDTIAALKGSVFYGGWAIPVLYRHLYQDQIFSLVGGCWVED